MGWLKFYFIGFFSDKYSGEGAWRSFWNLLLSFVLMVMIICTGLFTGFTVSFETHYKKAEEFREFIYQSFDGIGLELNDGKLSADIPNAESINTFIEEDDGVNGYKLILDTRPADKTYAEFSIICKDEKNNEISYDDYLLLSDSNKKNYTLQIEYSGKSLDITAGQSEYENYLNEKAGVTGKSTLAELQQRRDSGEITDYEYADSVYAAFVNEYYPSFSQIERYGNAPTLRTYYLGIATSGVSDKFLMLLDDVCVGSFEVSKNNNVNFEGYYNNLSDGIILEKGQNSSQNYDNLDNFIIGSFKGSSGFVYLMFLFNMFKLIPIIIIALLLMSFVVFVAIGHLTGNKIGYFSSLKIIGSYLLVSSIISFIISVILSFNNPRGVVYLVSVITLIGILVIRTAIYTVRLVLADRKAKAEEAKKSS